MRVTLCDRSTVLEVRAVTTASHGARVQSKRDFCSLTDPANILISAVTPITEYVIISIGLEMEREGEVGVGM